MKSKLRLLLLALCSIVLGHMIFAGEEPTDVSLHTLTELRGEKYCNQIEQLLKEPAILSKLAQSTANGENESIQQKILSAWLVNHETFHALFAAMIRYESISYGSVVSRSPIPLLFVMGRKSRHGDTLTPLAIEVVWKRNDLPEWRILAMLEILKDYATDDMLPVVADRLSTEKGTEICYSIFKVLSAKGGQKTLARLKMHSEEQGDNVELLTTCMKAISHEPIIPDRGLSFLANRSGIVYLIDRDFLLNDPMALSAVLKQENVDDIDVIQKNILLAWQSQEEVFNNIITDMMEKEYRARNRRRPLDPDPAVFAQKWNKQVGNQSVFLAVEAVWKLSDWPKWRILAMLEVLRSYASDEMLPAVADRLAVETNDDICNSMVSLLNTKGGPKTLSQLKLLSEPKRISHDRILSCIETITKRLADEQNN